MREILFRGKRTDNGEWIEGFYAKSGDKSYIIIDNDFAIGYVVMKDVIPETVGQYTGLNDKNGVKIFEGDVLQFSYTGENLGVEGQGTVVFENGKFGVLWGWHKDLVCLDGFANTEVEAIGNVFDNPELTR